MRDILFLVTGGAGFIGSNTVEGLLKKGYKVRVLDNFSTGKRENLRDFPKAEVIEGDITRRKVIKKAIKDVDYILHLAALTSVFRSLKEPQKTERVNIFGTLSLLLEAKEAKVKRFIYASSSSVYGDTPTLPKRVCMKPSPLSPYAISKLTAEYYCRMFYSLYGLETVSLRYFNVYGERQDPLSPYSAVIPKFISSIIKGKRVNIFGDGNQSRDFTYVKDVASANIKACLSEDVGGKVFNVGRGEKVAVNELFNKIKNILLKRGIRAKEPIYLPLRPGEVKNSLSDIEETKKLLGYLPKFNLQEGLSRTVEYYLKSR